MIRAPAFGSGPKVIRPRMILGFGDFTIRGIVNWDCQIFLASVSVVDIVQKSYQ